MNKPDVVRKSWDQVLISLLGAMVLLIAFDSWVNDFIAMPLRVISTTISEFVVVIFGYDVIREGTSLIVGTFRFNVDTACSGSQTMQYMLATSIVLVGIWGGMSLGQKAFSVVFAIPIAVFVNGLRVSALMLASIGEGKGLTEDTFAHQFIGVVAFSLALFLFWEVCKKVADTAIFNKTSKALQVIIVLILICVIFFPFIYEMLSSWVGSEWNPYNKFAGIFFLIAITFFLIYSYSDIRNVVKFGGRAGWNAYVGLILLGAGLALAVLVVKLGFVSAQGIGFVIALFGIGIVCFGFNKFLYEIPVIVIMLLSFPRIPLVVNEVVGRQVEYDWGVLFLFRVFVTLVLLVVYIYGKKKQRIKITDVNNVKVRSYWKGVIVLLLFSCGVGMLWQGYIDAVVGEESNSRAEVELFAGLPLEIGVWDGEIYPLSENTKDLLGGSDAVLKVYKSDYALPIEFFYNFSGGNRHNLHPPEYCLTGAGWKIVNKKSLNLIAQNGEYFPITVMELKNGADLRWFAFWFYDGASIKANYLRMLGEDLFSRLSGEKRNWSIYRVIAQREVDLMLFMDEISKRIGK